MVQASAVQHATFSAFRTVMLKALEGSYGETTVATSAPLSITPNTRRSLFRSAATVHSRCYASSSKAVSEPFQHHRHSEADSQGQSNLLPHGMQRLALDNFSQPQNDGVIRLPDSWTSMPPLPQPPVSEVKPSSTVPPDPSSLPTYSTSVSRITQMIRKKRARQALRKEVDEASRHLVGLLPSQGSPSSTNFTPRARFTLSDLDFFAASPDSGPSYVPSVSKCRTLIRNGQLFQGMNAFNKLCDAIMSRRDYLPFQEPPKPKPQQKKMSKQEKISKRKEMFEQKKSRQKRTAVESSAPLNDCILSPRDVSAIASDINRIASGGVHLDLSKEMDSKSPIWRTKSMPANLNPLDLPKPFLCAHALATIFDSTIALGYDPPQGVGAILLSCFSQSMSPECYTGAAELLLELHGLDGMGLGLLSSMMTGFSRLGQQDVAEKLLEDFAWAQAYIEQEQEQESQTQQSTAADSTRLSGPTQVYHVPNTQIPLHGWSSDGAIWCSMIRSKIIVGDVAAAYQWLSHFRQVRRECIAGNIPSSLMPPPSYTPYLTLMSGLEWRAVREKTKQHRREREAQQTHGTHVSEEAQASFGSPKEDAKISEIVQAMREDKIDFSPQVLNLLASFARRRRKGDVALEALHNIFMVDRKAGTPISEEQKRTLDAPAGSLGLDVKARATRASRVGRQLLTQGVSIVSPSHIPEVLLTVGQNWDTHAFAAMFDMLNFKPRSREEVSYQGEDVCKADGIVQNRRLLLRMNTQITSNIPLRPRTLFQTMLARHVISTQGILSRTSLFLSPRTLYKALRCALSRRYRDFPLALAILQAFRVCNVEVDTHQVFTLVSAAAEGQAEEARRMRMENVQDGDHSSPTHTARLFAAGLNEDKRKLSEWEWIDDHAIRKSAGGNMSMEKAMKSPALQAVDGVVQHEKSAAPLRHDPSMYEIKIKAMISLKNLLRWTIFQRVERMVQLQRLGSLAAKNEKGADAAASFEARDAEWDWTRSSSSSSSNPIVDQFSAFAKDRETQRQQQRDAPLPKSTAAGETEHEWRMSRLCVADVWQGVFDLCGESGEERGASEYVWGWEEDEIVHIRKCNGEDNCQSSRERTLEKQNKSASEEKAAVDGAGVTAVEGSSSVVEAPSGEVTASSGVAAEGVGNEPTGTSEVQSGPTGQSEPITGTVSVKRGRGRPRKESQMSSETPRSAPTAVTESALRGGSSASLADAPATTASAPKGRGRPRKHDSLLSQAPVDAPTTAASHPSRGRGRPRKNSAEVGGS